MKSEEVVEELNRLYPDARCELEYSCDYELLIATVLSAQCTDKRVNEVTKTLFHKYNLDTLAKANLKDIESIIRPCGSFTKKAYYLKTIAERLIKDYNGKVPNNREYLESLPGVGRKTCNVVLSNIYEVPAIAVDTHVARVSKRLSLAKESDDVTIIEKKLMKKFPKNVWSRLHHQLVLFGRYQCRAINPLCEDCHFRENCKYFKKNKRK